MKEAVDVKKGSTQLNGEQNLFQQFFPVTYTPKLIQVSLNGNHQVRAKNRHPQRVVTACDCSVSLWPPIGNVCRGVHRIKVSNKVCEYISKHFKESEMVLISYCERNILEF